MNLSDNCIVFYPLDARQTCTKAGTTEENIESEEPNLEKSSLASINESCANAQNRIPRMHLHACKDSNPTK